MWRDETGNSTRRASAPSPQSVLIAAIAGLSAAQGTIYDPDFKGPGHVYVIEGQTWPWGPDDPYATKIGCVNGNGKLAASNCAVFDANVTNLYLNGKVCGWTPRIGDGAQPSVFNCANPAYYGLYRFIGNADKPDYITYAFGQLAWTVDLRPTGNQVVDIFNGPGWTPIKVDLLWAPL